MYNDECEKGYYTNSPNISTTHFVKDVLFFSSDLYQYIC